MVQRIGSKPGDELRISERIEDFRILNADVENQLKAEEGYFKEVSE